MYALELCQASLDKFYRKDYAGPRLPSPANVLLQLAKGLAYIHLQKLIHRDIKPSNVLISSSTSPATIKWADFGFCKPVDSQGRHEVSVFAGTINWMAPEVIRNTKEGTTKSDVFSAGCVFFCHLTNGLHPFDGSGGIIVANISAGKSANFGGIYILVVTLL